MADTTREHQATAGDTQRTANELAGLSYQLGTLVETPGDRDRPVGEIGPVR